MATSTNRWSAPTSLTVAINGDGSSPTLKALANGSKKLGIEIDNTSTRHKYMALELLVRGASAFSSDGFVEIFLIPSIDGSNDTDGGDSVDPPLSQYRCSIPLRAVDTQQRLGVECVEIPPLKFKPLVINRGGQAFTNTNGENVLGYRLYSEESVSA